MLVNLFVNVTVNLKNIVIVSSDIIRLFCIIHVILLWYRISIKCNLISTEASSSYFVTSSHIGT